MTLPTASFWTQRRVLLTGHTGFKGSWAAIWLARLGADVTGIALAPDQEPALFDEAKVAASLTHHVLDIRDAGALGEAIRAARPEIVLHMAAQPLVRRSYADPLGTFATNVQGTANLLDSLRNLPDVQTVVAVTTDKVYRNDEHGFPYREGDPLGGHDPYSASKAASELVVDSYRKSFLEPQGVAVATARAGNVIGGGDWSNDRLLPDAIRAWLAGRPLEIRRPDAVRPWQHVLEPVAGYLVLAERLHAEPALAGAYNFGPHSHEAATVRDVVEIARAPGDEVRYGDGGEGPHEAGLLTLETARARRALGIRPRWPLETAVRRTFDWYRARADGADARRLCEADIDAYEAAA